MQSPPMPDNRLFPKSVHLVLGVLGVLDRVPIDLEEFGVRDGWILECRIEQQGVSSVVNNRRTFIRLC